MGVFQLDFRLHNRKDQKTGRVRENWLWNGKDSIGENALDTNRKRICIVTLLRERHEGLYL